jgi:5-formyltetrahydrofolate cyclo-ligase
MLKSLARREYLQQRLQLPAEEIHNFTIAMKQLFSGMQLPPVGALLSYYPLTSRQEFNVAVCDSIVLERNPGAKIAWPKTDTETLSMEAHVLEEHGLFAKNKYNILEPIGNYVLLPDQVDLVFVPLLAFDRLGYRVGYGKGYYDRYLRRCRKDVMTIGFSFFEPIDTIRDIDQFDVPLKYCITPSRLYEF